MKKFLVFNIFVTIVLLILFLWQSYKAIDKFLIKSTWMPRTSIDEGVVLYPSVSVCKRYFFGPTTKEIMNDSVPIQIKIQKIQNNTWNKDKLFYFVSHSKMFNVTFPCNTIKGGSDPGKPCSFPLVQSNNITTNSCMDGFNFKWCVTR